jgi:hypothetical protein
LQTGQTPPEAAVGNEGQTPRNWERATNQIDCERAAGLWDATNNRCLENGRASVMGSALRAWTSRMEKSSSSLFSC